MRRLLHNKRNLQQPNRRQKKHTQKHKQTILSRNNRTRNHMGQRPTLRNKTPLHKRTTISKKIQNKPTHIQTIQEQQH